MVKKEMEDRRKERLAYVGISLNNVLPAKDKKEKKSHKSSESDESSRGNTPSASEESDSDEPIYQLRQRRQAHSYKFQDYDDLINSALQVRNRNHLCCNFIQKSGFYGGKFLNAACCEPAELVT